jgi:hypothetical protein
MEFASKLEIIGTMFWPVNPYVSPSRLANTLEEHWGSEGEGKWIEGWPWVVNFSNLVA